MLISTAVPLPKVNSTYLYLEDFHTSITPTSLEKALGIGTVSPVITTPINHNAAYLDILAMLGAGSVGVAHGLVVSAGTGLNASVSAGTAFCNGPTQKKTASTVALNAFSTNYIWLADNGTFTVQDDIITAPTGDYVYLGAAITSGVAVTSVDLSGVVYLINGIAFREVGDTDQPVDTPNSAWRGFTKTARATYFWNGTAYVVLTSGVTPGNGYKAITGAKADADYTLTASEYSNEIIKLGWTGWSTGRNVVVPTVAGAKWVIYNSLGKTVTVKTASGTGIAIASTKSAIVYCDGTNIARATGDI